MPPTYNFAEHLRDRQKMIPAWPDYLDGLKAGTDVIWRRRRAA